LKVELKKKENELAQEEEKLRLKRTELESMKTEISPERLMEEEERLRIRGEELFDAKIKLEREKREVAQEEEVISKQGIEIQIRRRMLDETMGDLTEEEEHLKARNEIYSKVKEKITELKGLEEEETLRGLQNRVESVVEGMNRADIDWMMRETETLKKKENKIGEIMTELEERYKEIRQKELEIERMKERWQIEEAEKLRKKEEELFSLKNEAEIKSRVAEELRKQLKAKETELHAIKTEYEKQMRKKIEDEEMLKVRELTEKEREKHKAKRMLYPFAAIVGQETMKKTLILNAVNPLIGGVLIRGQKGTAKSVSVRGLAEVLPEIECVAGCRYNCDPSDEENLCDECRTRKETGRFTIIKKPIPVIDLPLNVTEDRLIGSIDIEKILTEGKKAFEPGLFAECHRGILYVDEINLLDDYIVDLLLDAAAMGVVHVEREGVSISYLSRFIIVGSMNPEEGELRPQILDRIALQAEVTGIRDVAQRVEIVKRRDEFTKDPEGFRKKYAKDQEELRKKIISARELLPRVTTPEPLLKIISHLCIDFDAAGHRADIIIERTARTNAALNGRLETSLADIAEAAVLALPHRMRANPIVGEPFTPETVLKRLRKYEKEVK
jgi:magnesium chelatase subunit I